MRFVVCGFYGDDYEDCSFWYGTNVARWIDTDVYSDHASFIIMCLLSAPKRTNLNNSSRQNQNLGQIVTLNLFGLSWCWRCCIYKIIYTLSGLV